METIIVGGGEVVIDEDTNYFNDETTVSYDNTNKFDKDSFAFLFVGRKRKN